MSVVSIFNRTWLRIVLRAYIFTIFLHVVTKRFPGLLTRVSHILLWMSGSMQWRSFPQFDNLAFSAYYVVCRKILAHTFICTFIGKLFLYQTVVYWIVRIRRTAKFLSVVQYILLQDNNIILSLLGRNLSLHQRKRFSTLPDYILSIFYGL